MLELRRRFKGEVVALSEYLDRDLVSLWGYDASAERGARTSAAGRPEGSRLLRRRPPQERHHGAVRDAAAPSADLHARGARSRGSSQRLHSRHRTALGGRPPQTLEQYLALFADARPDQRVGEASPSYLRSRRTAAGESPRPSRARGSSRSCASRRAFCARSTCSACRLTWRRRRTSARRSALERDRRRGQA